jgi:hypothetical protein
MLLSYSIFQLLQVDVDEATISVVEASLNKFVEGVERLYGREHCSFNVHLSTQLCSSVRISGPLSKK